MTTYVFVPLSDELIFNHPEKITGPLVPFNAASMVENREDGASKAGSTGEKDSLPQSVAQQAKRRTDA